MQLNPLFNSRYKLYNEHLQEISGIKFTLREIDIISCILYDKSEKKIAKTLAITTKALEAHSLNIINKLALNSKEQILSVIEKSQKLDFFKQYYMNLLVQILFEKYLREIALLNTQTIRCVINNVDHDNQESIRHLNQLVNDLNLINVSVKTNIAVSNQVPNKYTYIYIITDLKDTIPESSIGLIIQPPNEFHMSELKTKNLVNFSSKQNYYFSFFELLQKISNNSQITSIKEKFQYEYEIIVKSINTNTCTTSTSEQSSVITSSQNSLLVLKKDTKLKTFISFIFKGKVTCFIITAVCIFVILSYTLSE